jgi:hypothetical protein
VEHVGVEDNFFEVGGHSLTAASLAARVETEMKVRLTLQTIFEKPTIAALAGCIDVGNECDTVAPIARLHQMRRANLLERIDQLSSEELDLYLEATEYLE